MKKMKVAVIGTLASGKGTQSHILSVLMGAPAVSIGDLLRDLQGEDSERGRSAKVEMAKGAFVPDGVILPLVKAWISKRPKGWIVDGFPRSIAQADACARFFKPDAVVYLEIPDAEALRRSTYRRVCSKCKTNYNLATQPPHDPQGRCDVCGGTLVRREDDAPEIVERRLRHHHEVTEPLKQRFAKSRRLVLVDARDGIPEVAREVQRQLESFMAARDRKRRIAAWCLFATAAALSIAVLCVYTGWVLNG